MDAGEGWKDSLCCSFTQSKKEKKTKEKSERLLWLIVVPDASLIEWFVLYFNIHLCYQDANGVKGPVCKKLAAHTAEDGDCENLKPHFPLMDGKLRKYTFLHIASRSKSLWIYQYFWVLDLNMDYIYIEEEEDKE